MPRGRPRGQPAAQEEQGEGAGEDIFGSFEFWQPGRGPRRENTCSIGNNGIISVAANLARYVLKDQESGKVQLGYNAQNKQVVIVAASNGAGRTLGKVKGQRYHISAKPFLEMHHILPDQRVDRECERVESGGQRGIIFSLP